MAYTRGTVPDLITPYIHRKYCKTFERLSKNADKYIKRHFAKEIGYKVLNDFSEIKIRPQVEVLTKGE